DLPQAVNAAGNNHAKSMLLRDVRNLTTYFGRYAPELLETDYGREIWALYEDGALHPQVELTGAYTASTAPVDLDAIMVEIEDARAEEAARRLREAASE
ncbi:MAG: RIO1 family regulatory kinase/ATPase, partial [Pseudomonadota bacterium]